MALDELFYSGENLDALGVRFVTDGSLQTNCAQPGNGLVLYPNSGAIAVQSQTALLTKAGTDVMTLAAPKFDGQLITFISTTANPHTVTATGLFKTGSAAVNLATFPSQIGAGFTVMGYQGLWYVISNTAVAFT